MSVHFPVNKMLTKTLAAMAKHSEETLHRNNACIQSLKDTIMIANRNSLLTMKASLVAFTETESQRNFQNRLIGLFLQLIEQHLKNR